MKRLVGFAMAAVVLAGTNVLGGDGKDALKGTWAATEFEFMGMKKPAPEGAFGLTFAGGGKLTLKDGKKGDKQGTYKADASKKPAHVDITVKDGEKTETVRAIYEVTGNSMKLGFPIGGPKGDRPKDFNAEGSVIIHLKKQKS